MARQKFFWYHLHPDINECSKGTLTAQLHLSQGAAAEWGINVGFFSHLHPQQHCRPLPKPTKILKGDQAGKTAENMYVPRHDPLSSGKGAT